MEQFAEKNNTCCFTGHRSIPPGAVPRLYSRLLECVDALARIGVCDFISGGAVGFDRLCERAVLETKKSHPHIRLTIVIPCEDQHRKWNVSDKREYEAMLKLADRVICLNEKYVTGCMHQRNRFMVEKSSYCVAFYTGKGGGTRYTLELARELDLDVINLV